MEIWAHRDFCPLCAFGGKQLQADEPSIFITIHPRMSIIEMGKVLQDKNVIYNRWFFYLYVLIRNERKNLKCGQYRFLKNMKLNDVVSYLKEGHIIVHKITIPEGLTIYKILKIIKNNPCLSGRIENIPPEGSLLPGTYYFLDNESRENILNLMQKKMRKKLQEFSLISSLNEENIVKLASIVEKETKIPQEKELIAGVFLKRLQMGMRLQADPTIIYGLTGGKGILKRALNRKDWKFDSPYNTYIYQGLPPTPICCPGVKTLESVAKAKPGVYLFFVADGKGGHLFSKNLKHHNKNIILSRNNK